MLFGSSFGFYYLFFLFGSIIYVVWKLKSCLLGLRCSTASLSLLRFSWTLEFKGVIFYPVDNIYSRKYVCMYVCMSDLHEKDRESIFKKLGSLFKLLFFSQWGSFIPWCSMFNPLFRFCLFRTFSLPYTSVFLPKKGPLDQGQVSFQIPLSLWNF